MLKGTRNKVIFALGLTGGGRRAVWVRLARFEPPPSPARTKHSKVIVFYGRFMFFANRFSLASLRLYCFASTLFCYIFFLIYIRVNYT